MRLAHLFEHLLFKGTERRAVGQVAREIESLGGDVNAYTSYDQTVMHITLPSRNWRQGLDILADCLLNSIVDQDELEKEKLVVVLYYYENLTLREIGEILDVSESRVCQIHTKVIMRLRSHLMKKGGEITLEV